MNPNQPFLLALAVALATGALSLAVPCQPPASGWKKIDTAKTPLARTGHAMAYDSNRGRTVLFGGFGLGDTWEYRWRQLDAALAPHVAADALRRGHGL